MSCTNNHNDSTKKFCPECGTKMTVDLITRLNELLNEVITENKYKEFNPKDNAHMKQLLVKMMSNNILIKNQDNFVIFNNEFFTLETFTIKYPFFTQDRSNYEAVDMFYIPINFEQKQKDWKRCIPNDVPSNIKNMLNNIMDTFDKKLFVEDNDKVITALKSYCDKNTKQRGKYTDMDYLKYFLQNIKFKIDDDSLYLCHENYRDDTFSRVDKISLIAVNENKLRFVIFDEDRKPALRFTNDKIIKCDMRGYWNESSSTDSVKKEDIKKWFEDRPSTFKRDLDIETEFLNTVSD